MQNTFEGLPQNFCNSLLKLNTPAVPCRLSYGFFGG